MGKTNLKELCFFFDKKTGKCLHEGILPSKALAAVSDPTFIICTVRGDATARGFKGDVVGQKSCNGYQSRESTASKLSEE